MTTLFSPQASRARMRNQPWTTCVICRHRSKGPRETVLVIAVVNLTALFGGELLPDFEPRARLHARLSSPIEPRFSLYSSSYLTHPFSFPFLPCSRRRAHPHASNVTCPTHSCPRLRALVPVSPFFRPLSFLCNML